MRPQLNNRLLLPATILAVGMVGMPAAVQAAVAGSTSATGTGTATCPVGYRVSGGGFTMPADWDDPYSTNFRTFKMAYSRPLGTTAWQVGAYMTYRNGGAVTTVTTTSVKVHATCVK